MNFENEARWLLVVALVVPLVAFLLAIVIPSLAR
jgi:hypothetical protein